MDNLKIDTGSGNVKYYSSSHYSNGRYPSNHYSSMPTTHRNTVSTAQRNPVENRGIQYTNNNSNDRPITINNSKQKKYESLFQSIMNPKHKDYRNYLKNNKAPNDNPSLSTDKRISTQYNGRMTYQGEHPTKYNVDYTKNHNNTSSTIPNVKNYLINTNLPQNSTHRPISSVVQNNNLSVDKDYLRKKQQNQNIQISENNSTNRSINNTLNTERPLFHFNHISMQSNRIGQATYRKPNINNSDQEENIEIPYQHQNILIKNS